MDRPNGTLVASTLTNQTLQICADEDIQPLALQQLKQFGDWLCVDSYRILEGQDALHESRSRALHFADVVIGQSSQDVANLVRHQKQLTAVFLFVCGCSVFDVERTSRVIHGLMQLKSLATVEVHHICKLVELIVGYRDSLRYDTPFEIHNWLADRANSQASAQELRLMRLYDDMDDASIVSLFYSVIESLKQDNALKIYLQGSRMGIWISTLFIWLYPKMVEVRVGNSTIYPEIQEVGPNSAACPRIFILMEEYIFPLDTHWKVQDSTAEDNSIPWIETAAMIRPHSPTPTQYIAVPLQSTKDQVSAILCSDRLAEKAGYFASALVIAVVDMGHVTVGAPHSDNLRRENSLPIKNIMSKRFLTEYCESGEHFGWSNLDKDKVERIANTIKLSLRRLHNFARESRTLPHADRYSTPDACSKLYETLTRECDVFLDEGLVDKLKVLEHSYQITLEAIYLGLFENRPVHAVHRSGPDFDSDPENMVRRLLLPLDAPQGQRVLKDFCYFRQQAARTCLPGTPDWNGDEELLAATADGYVIFLNPLDPAQRDQMTCPNSVATFQAHPGTLRVAGSKTRFAQLANVAQQQSPYLDLVPGRRRPGAILEYERRFESLPPTGNIAWRNRNDLELRSSISTPPPWGGAAIVTSNDRSIDNMSSTHLERPGLVHRVSTRTSWYAAIVAAVVASAEHGEQGQDRDDDDDENDKEEEEEEEEEDKDETKTTTNTY